MRKLATIQRIIDLQPIPNADAIEVATIKGWKVVVKKNEFKINDFCVYCEIDSIMPEISEFEFLRERKFRIKTMKLRGQISQGIAFPLSILNTETPPIVDDYDVTELLGVTLYEPIIPEQLRGQIKRQFPTYLFPKTDEERIQNIPNILEEFKDDIFYATEKIDGSSISIYKFKGETGICSRNMEFTNEDNSLYSKIAKELDIPEKLKLVNYDIALQGELIGERVQGNKYNSKNTILFYSGYNITDQKYLNFNELFTLLRELNLETVPLIGVANLNDFGTTVEEIINFSKGFSFLNSKVMREGVVFRLVGSNGKVSFKAINPEFLLKYE
jgi:RNA ligase (TIGR02306 family)